MGDELERLQELESRRPTADEISDVLPDAVALRSQRDSELDGALSPTIEGSLERAVQRNPQRIADAIFPIIGPAIRKSMRAALSSIVEGFNRALEESFTLRGLGWRIEAWRSGTPYPEVVLTHSLVYRVEQLFLIHERTGVQLEHLTAPAIQAQDPDLVTAMLSALQAFMRDSFPQEGEQRATLNHFEFGELRFEVAAGPHATLAAVVRGTAPSAYRELLQDTIERIHTAVGPELVEFDGDTGPFLRIHDLLEECLAEQRVQHQKSRFASFAKRAVAVLLLALLATWIISTLWGNWREAQADDKAAAARLEHAFKSVEELEAQAAGTQQLLARLAADVQRLADEEERARQERAAADGRRQVLDARRARLSELRRALDAEPGLAVTATELAAEGAAQAFVVAGLRDPHARAPLTVAAQAGFDPNLIDAHWTPWLSPAPDLVLARMREQLAPPATVSLAYDGERVSAHGTAPRAWIERAALVGPGLAPTLSFDTTALQPSDPPVPAGPLPMDPALADYVRRLADEPGLVVLDYAMGDPLPSGRQLVLEGLRDPDARDPLEVARDAALDTTRLHALWTPYESGDPVLLLAKARRQLAPPAGVVLDGDGRRLVASGRAPGDWIRRARTWVTAHAANASYDDSAVVDIDRQELDERATELELLAFYFELADHDVDLSDTERADLTRLLRQLDDAARRSSRLVRIVVHGHIDGSETIRGGVEVARRRAGAMAQELERLAPAGAVFTSLGVPTADEQDGLPVGSIHRKVTFEVITFGADSDPSGTPR